MRQRRRAIVIAGVVLAVAWTVAWMGHSIARRSKMTADKFRHYVQSVDFSQLKGEERDQAMQTLADKLNALPYDERRQVRLNREWEGWFTQMTDPEKEKFVEATFPTGIKQMIAAFEKLPEEKRRKTIDEAVRRLHQAREQNAEGTWAPDGDRKRASPPPEISLETEAKIRAVGLRSYIANSSAQTKAEVAPLLEEIQRIVESGGHIHGGR